MRVAVVGGGIAGLSAAWELRDRAEVTVFEPGRLGGCIGTVDLDGFTVEQGPDAFLTRVPEAVQLCREIGIEDQLVAPAAGRAALWWRGRLRPLPEGLVLGAPAELGAVARSGILSPAGALRAGLDLVLPATPPRDRDTVRDLVRRRFGAEVADRLVDPLVGGIHAGWTAELGAAETTPQLVDAARRSRSLLLGLRAGARPRRTDAPGPPPAPVFLAPHDGLGSLVDMLVGRLAEAGVRFVDVAVERVISLSEGAVRVAPHPEPFDAVVVATAAKVAAGLLGGAAAGRLESIPAASVAVATVVVEADTIPEGLSGFLVPRGQGKAMTACSFSSNKWPHRSQRAQSSVRTGKRAAVVRISAGRRGEAEVLGNDDAALLERLVDELGQALGRPVGAGAGMVSRWPEAFPQYLPGHTALVDSVERALRRDHPTVALAGSYYRGSGIPACIASGRGAAEHALQAVTTPAL